MTGQQVMARIRERDDGEILSLIKRLARAHHVTVDELLGRDRTPAASHARQALWEALNATGHWSLVRLGKVFGRDHVTILHGITAHRVRNGLPPLVSKPGITRCQPIEQPLPTVGEP